MPNATQLARLRAVDEKNMDQVADIVSKVRVKDSSGGNRVTESVQSNVKCRVTPQMAGNVETQFGGQLVSGLQWLFSFPVGTVVDKDDEIRHAGKTYAVVGVLGPRSFELSRQAVAMKK